MFKNMLDWFKDTPNKNSPTFVIYENYKAAIQSRLAPWGFTVVLDTNRAISGLTVYQRDKLKVMVGYDMRDDPGVYLYAQSGKKVPAKSGIDEMARVAGKKPTNYDEVTDTLVDAYDMQLPLGGSEEERSRLMRDLETWYREHS